MRSLLKEVIMRIPAADAVCLNNRDMTVLLQFEIDVVRERVINTNGSAIIRWYINSA